MLPLAGDPVREAGVREATATESEAASVPEPSDEESMASSAERMTILRMVEQGKISAEDGARLLAALGDRQTAEGKPRAAFDTSRHLQVRVTDLMTNRQKVNVNVPVGLVQLVWRWLPESAQAQMDSLQNAIDSGTSGRLIEVMDQESGVRVEITLL
jgi:hypothetical protein